MVWISVEHLIAEIKDTCLSNLMGSIPDNGVMKCSLHNAVDFDFLANGHLKVVVLDSCGFGNLFSSWSVIPELHCARKSDQYPALSTIIELNPRNKL